MENTARLIWLSNGAGRDGNEPRLIDSLRTVLPVVVCRIGSLETLTFERGDFVLLNASQVDEETESTVERIQAAAPQAKLLVRCKLGDDESPVETGVRIPSVGYLDTEEGPELTRARVVRWMADGRTNVPAVAPVPEWRKQLVGRSHALQRVAEVIRLVGPRRCTVLITGETGTGKEVAARAIHRAGSRGSGPFVALNCGAIPAALLEAELFGHTRGAFTGATQTRAGRFEQAHGGTLFLDEIGDLPLDLQAKLLRVLQEREVQKLGSSETVRVDARVVAATNRNLQERVRQGLFREDLFYRLNVVPLHLPPLRERASDIRLLAEHFLAKICAEEEIRPKRLTVDAWQALERYTWPGNVRQLENCISAAVILSDDQVFLDRDHFSLPYAAGVPSHREDAGPVALPDHGLDFTETVNALERNLLSQALRKTGGNKKAAAEMLRLKRTTLAAKVRVLELTEGAA